MSRRHNPWDNAVAESLFATLKREIPNPQPNQVAADVTQVVRSYIGWYNNVRLHSALGYRSPADFELAEFGIKSE